MKTYLLYTDCMDSVHIKYSGRKVKIAKWEIRGRGMMKENELPIIHFLVMLFSPYMHNVLSNLYSHR